MAKDESRRGAGGWGGGKRRHSSGRQEKIDGGEASNETAVDMAARDMRSPKTYFSGGS